MSSLGRDGLKTLLIVGSSVRAAAASAARCGYRVIGADQFGDDDLREIAAAVDVLHDWPGALPSTVASLIQRHRIDGWLYCGALENHPDLLAELSRRLPLLGCEAEVVRRLRDPVWLRRVLVDAGLSALEIRNAPASAGQWIEKPIASGAGLGVRRWQIGDELRPGHMLQEFADGPVVSGLYLAEKEGPVRLLGLSRQFFGELQTGADGFLYCGSIAPLPMSHDDSNPDNLSQDKATGLSFNIHQQALRFGEVIAQAAGPTGLFGIDFVADEAIRRLRLLLLEVNPRYPASAELYERVFGWPLLKWHVDACEGRLSASVDDALSQALETSQTRAARCAGRVIVYAPIRLVAPDMRAVCHRLLPDFLVADVPRTGSVIEAGHPVCTLLTDEASVAECGQRLLKGAERLRAALAGVPEARR